ncbi:MAG: glycosyltransferase family 4 protein [Candidatus Nanopelagicales bacterium]
MKIGIVCPYDWSVPGGVQIHIRDLTMRLRELGHDVNVLSPVSNQDSLEDWVTNGGDPISLTYNGSVARVSFGLRATRKVRQWLRTQQFDVVHVHEPLSPSLSSLTCWAATGPIVGTFHSSMDRSRMLQAGYGLAQTVLEKVYGRIAVSEAARKTVVEHVGGDAVLIPNGIDVDFFDRIAKQSIKQEYRIVFLGRFEEDRKGFSLLAEAFNRLAAKFPKLSLDVAGPGNPDNVIDAIDKDFQNRITFHGRVSDERKAQLLSSGSVYVAPNTGGESFGIVLLEAMASGVAVVASDIPAFERVLDFGEAGTLFQNENVDALVEALDSVLTNEVATSTRVTYARDWVKEFDWHFVAQKIIAVYETVTFDQLPVVENLRGQIIGRLKRSES